MACQAMHMWSLSGLVAAFLDLAIAYLLLCASAIAFFASKVLGFFGLKLPCPCDGLFLNTPSKEYCLSRLLFDLPNQKLSNVHLSVKRNFPFDDSVRARSHNFENRIVEMESEGSCSSVSDARIRRNVVGEEFIIEKYDVKGKGVVDHRLRSRLRQMRKGGRGRGIYSSVSSYDSSQNEEAIDEEPVDDFGAPRLKYIDDQKAPIVKGVTQRSLTNVQWDQYHEEDTRVKKNGIFMEEPQGTPREFEILSGNEDIVRHLEQELEEVHTVRAALYVELEKERSAAASAADEAMAMILRLQEEKASIEMEARQYQRILEEKSAYDAEEMNILKEILVRREREKLFLEREVEAYRQVVSLGNEESAMNGLEDSGKYSGLPLDPDDDPLMMLHGLIESIDKKVMVGNESLIQYQDEQLRFQKQGDFDEQSKELLIEECKLLENNVSLEEKQLAQVEEVYPSHKPAEEVTLACNGTENGDLHYDLSFKQESNNVIFNVDSRVYDVHVIDDPIDLSSEVNASKTVDLASSRFHGGNLDLPEASVTKKVDVTTESHLDSEVDVRRSNSNITSALPPMGPKIKPLLSNLRRNSMSAVDSEMLKIDCEVSNLRERLKTVQEGREKLGFSMESGEGENIQLKLLQDIALQLQEICCITQPGMSECVSLPLPTSMVQNYSVLILFCFVEGKMLQKCLFGVSEKLKRMRCPMPESGIEDL